MKTTLLKQLHERSPNILDMIERAERQVKSHEEDINRYACMFDYKWSDHYRERALINKAISARLQKSYYNTLTRINSVANSAD